MIKAACFVSASVGFCFLSGCRPAVDRTLEELIDHSYPVEPIATLSVTNRDGSIRVYAAGGETRDVRVEAIKKAYSTERLKAISIQVSAKPNLDGMRSEEARARLGNGRLFAHNCFGNLDLSLETGNLAIVYEWWEDLEFSIHVAIQSGNAFAYIPSDAAFHLVAHTATGKIANDFAEKEERHAEPINQIDMLVAGGGKTTFEFKTRDGNVKITEHNP